MKPGKLQRVSAVTSSVTPASFRMRLFLPHFMLFAVFFVVERSSIDFSSSNVLETPKRCEDARAKFAQQASNK